MTSVFSGIDPETYRAHALHSSERAWPETNCYVDLWIEVLASSGVAPEAMLGFTLTQDFEGDQFTFFKVRSRISKRSTVFAPPSLPSTTVSNAMSRFRSPVPVSA